MALSEQQLILSILERLEGQSARIIDRLDGVETRQEGTRVELAGLKEQVRIANGRTSKIEGRLHLIEERQKHEDAVKEGREEVRAANRSRVMAIWGASERYVLMAAAALIFGVGIRIGAFLIGGPW